MLCYSASIGRETVRFDPARHPDGVKKRRHHNNKGMAQIKKGVPYDQVRAMALRLGIPYLSRDEANKPRRGRMPRWPIDE